MQQHRPVPATGFSRLLHLGRLGSGIASGVISEGVRQLSNGNRLKAADLIMTPANANRLAERLSEMRGAAMKLGQLLSMEAGDLLPDPLPDILSRLRENAHPMPLRVEQGSDASRRRTFSIFTASSADSNLPCKRLRARLRAFTIGTKSIHIGSARQPLKKSQTCPREV